MTAEDAEGGCVEESRKPKIDDDTTLNIDDDFENQENTTFDE